MKEVEQKRQRMKLILDTLRQKPMTIYEIKNLVYKNNDKINERTKDRTIQRYLADLKALHLITMVNHKYIVTFIDRWSYYNELTESG